MNRRGFLKLCGMAVVGMGLPVGTTAGITGTEVLLRGRFQMQSVWAKNVFDHSMLNMELTNFIRHSDGTTTKKNLIRWTPEAA